MSERDWVERAIGGAEYERLASELPGTELQSVLLLVMNERAKHRSPNDVLSQYSRDAFTQPALVDQRTSVAIDAHLLAAAEGFEAVELSPVAPLGTCSAVALTTQNRVLSALRGTEVVSDPTNVLALECATRLSVDRDSTAHLATSQRVVRAQPVPKVVGYAPHFRIFTLGSGGIETKDHGFTRATMVLHITTMLRALERLEENGYAFGKRRVEVLATPQRSVLGDSIVRDLGPIATRSLLDHAYYSAGLRYQIWVTTADGAPLPLVDGGSFDWLTKLTSNRRAVFVASGAGAQLIAARFKKAP